MNNINKLYKTDCPFEGWQILQAKMVLDWVWNNIQDESLIDVAVRVIKILKGKIF